MRALLAALGATAALATGCSDDTATPAPTTTPSASSSAAASTDVFTALKPPQSPGVGGFEVSVSRRAYEAARGLLALSLGETQTLDGTGTSALLEALDVPEAAFEAEGLRPPTREGLGVRPLLARTVSLTSIEVVRSTYTADEVTGRGGETGLRITWDGSVRYRVTQQGAPHELAYALRISYVFGRVADEPGGLRLVQVVPLAWHAAPVIADCLSEGVLVPGAGAPSEADYAAGPWPSAPAGPPCPV